MFDWVVTSEEVGYEKPAIEFFNYVENFFEDIEINEYKIYAIGDSYENDIQHWKERYNASSYLIKIMRIYLIKKFNIKIEYLEVRNILDLKKDITSKKYKLFISYYLNKVRLIDNF